MSTQEAGYVHGYTAEEQQRLVDQSLYLEPWVFDRIDFSNASRVLEVGCGVGAQLKILARRFPHLKLTGVDRSPTQLAQAKVVLKDEVARGTVNLALADGGAMPFAPGEFDGAFLCWVLEHAPRPETLLDGLKRVLAPDAVVYATEVFNASLFIRPECPSVGEFWRLLNQRQQELGGDPFVGSRLGNLFQGAGYRDVEVWPVLFLLDARWHDSAKRHAFFEYWRALFHSAVPGLIEAGRATPALSRGIDEDFARLARDPETVFYVCALQARARV